MIVMRAQYGPGVPALTAGSLSPLEGWAAAGLPLSLCRGHRGWTIHGRAAGLDQAFAEGQAGQVGAAAAAGLVPDPVQVGPDGADGDVQLPGDVRVGTRPAPRNLVSNANIWIPGPNTAAESADLI